LDTLVVCQINNNVSPIKELGHVKKMSIKFDLLKLISFCCPNITDIAATLTVRLTIFTLALFSAVNKWMSPSI